MIYFNFRSRLISPLVRYACYGQIAYDDATMTEQERENWNSIINPCCQTIIEIFKSDSSLEVCKEIVQGIGALARKAGVSKKHRPIHNSADETKETKRADTKETSNRFKLNPFLLDTLLGLRLDRSEEAALAENNDERGLDDELQRELLASSIHSANSKVLKNIEMEILTEIIVIYLRIMRTKSLHSNQVLVSALRGLAKFSILVNLELLLEVLDELREVLVDAINATNPQNSMLALTCCFQVLGDCPNNIPKYFLLKAPIKRRVFLLLRF